MLERLAAIFLVLISTLVAPARMAVPSWCVERDGCSGLAEAACCDSDEECPCCVGVPAPRREAPVLPGTERDTLAKLVMLQPSVETVIALPRPAPRMIATSPMNVPRFSCERVQAAICVWRT